MGKLFRRLLALALALVMLPVCAFSEDAHGTGFDLTLTMDPYAFPGGDAKVLAGIADLLNILTVSGTLETCGDSFDLHATLLLDGQEATRTPLRVFGLPSHWGIQSTLLGDETVMVNMLALLEFAMKTYAHLDVPLQRVALLVSPYVHTSAFEGLKSIWNPVMRDAAGSRTIPRADVLAMLSALSDRAPRDRAFVYWVRALAMETGYDETIMSFLYDLPEWADGFLGKDGIVIDFSNGTEVWRTGSITLLTKSDTGWALTLPPSLEDGYALNASFQQKNGTLNASVTVSCDEPGDILSLALSICREDSGVLSASYDVSGDAAGAGVHLRVSGESSEGALTLHLFPQSSDVPLLTFNAALRPYTSDEFAFTSSDVDGVNILSVNDASLTDFMGRIASPLLRGLFPLLRYTPASSCQSLLNLLEDSGILAMLTSGTSADEDSEGWDEGWESDEWSEEDWNEEDWE